MITVEPGGKIARIGVVSDTHIPARGRFLPQALFTALRDVQLVLHAGDLVQESVLDELRALAPVEAVSGNMDPPPLRKRLGRKKLVKIGKVLIGLIHGEGAHRSALQRALEVFRSLRPAVIVFGHSHMPLCETHEGILMFNPGSAVDPRRAPGPSCGLLTVKGGRIRGEIRFI